MTMDYNSQIERLHQLWKAMDLDNVRQLDEAIVVAQAEFEDLEETEITGIFYDYVDDLWDLEEEELESEYDDEEDDDEDYGLDNDYDEDYDF